MKEEWRKTEAYFNEIRVCRVPEGFEERVPEDEFNEHMLRESKKRGRKVLDGFIIEKKDKGTQGEKFERREVKIVSLNGMRVCM